MSQRTQTQSREPDPPMGLYEETFNYHKQKREQQANGTVVIRSKETEWETARQGRLRYFSHHRFYSKLAAPGWQIFQQDIRRHSGKHVHQGGLVIFVLQGTGYTVVNGVRYDWKKGDLIVLPIQPGGCEHQHFNSNEGEPCHWMAFVYRPLKESLGSEFTQRELSPEFQPA